MKHMKNMKNMKPNKKKEPFLIIFIRTHQSKKIDNVVSMNLTCTPSYFTLL